MTRASYPHDFKLAIQCTDRNSGKVGTFLYLPGAPFFAASPVFEDCAQCFDYMNKNSLALVPGTIAGVNRAA